MGVVSDLISKLTGWRKEAPPIIHQNPEPVLFLSDYEGDSLLNVAYPDGYLECMFISKSDAYKIGAVGKALNPPPGANLEDLKHLTETALTALRSIEDLGPEINAELARHEDLLCNQLADLFGRTECSANV